MNDLDWIRYDTTPRSDLSLFFKTIRLTGRDFFEQMLYLSGGNIVAMLTIPLVLLTPPALGGIWWAAERASQEEEINYRTLLEGAKALFVPFWVWALPNVVVGLIVMLNVTFYGTGNPPLPFEAGPEIYPILVALWTGVGIAWSAYSLLVAGWMTSESPRPKDAFVGGLRLMIEHPIFTVLLAVVVGLFVALHFILPALLFLVTWAILAPLSVRSVQLLVHGVPIPLTPEEYEQLELKRRQRRRAGESQ